MDPRSLERIPYPRRKNLLSPEERLEGVIVEIKEFEQKLEDYAMGAYKKQDMEALEY